ncbi:GGDEF domain-containing protein [Enterobacter quasihormaechei]|uniref:GGDEF domain-containing protein n=1 Tax=Enterobacter quasihormaechei TaxID=2529382 RepID=UPI002F3E3816
MVTNARVDFEQRRELRTQVMYDSLTGLLNRRAFDRLLEELQKNPRSCCIALLDIDNFKSINDRWGHLMDDEVLQRLSSLAEEQLSQGDTRVFRYGGEEIAIVFLDMSRDHALEALEKLRAATASQVWRHGPEWVTFSAGFSSCDALGIHAAVRKADELLYEAKRLGKNRIVNH